MRAPRPGRRLWTLPCPLPDQPGPVRSANPKARDAQHLPDSRTAAGLRGGRDDRSAGHCRARRRGRRIPDLCRSRATADHGAGGRGGRRVDRRRYRPVGSTGRSILVPLATGQFAGHWALTGLTGHHETIGDTTAGALPAGTMTAAHMAAVAACALAITAAERLYRSASTVVRALLGPPGPVPAVPRVHVATPVAVAAHRSPNGSSGPRAPPARSTPDTPVPLGEKAFDTCPTGSPPSCAGV